MPQRALHHIRLVFCFERMFSFFFVVPGWGPLESFAAEHTLLCSGGVYCCSSVSLSNSRRDTLEFKWWRRDTPSCFRRNSFKYESITDERQSFWSLIDIHLKENEANVSERACSLLFFIRLSSVFSLHVFKGPSSLWMSFLQHVSP